MTYQAVQTSNRSLVLVGMYKRYFRLEKQHKQNKAGHMKIETRESYTEMFNISYKKIVILLVVPYYEYY